jgi:hypothetical protein
MGFESGGRNLSEFLLAGSQRCKGRSLSGGVGQSVPAYGVKGAEHFELKRTRLGIENEMALAGQNRPLSAMVNPACADSKQSTVTLLGCCPN